MLKPIPSRILKQTVVFNSCTAVDAWQNPTYSATTVTRCCIQPANETRKTKDNTEVVLRSLLFVDYRLSTPSGLDIDALKNTSEANGHTLTVIFSGQNYTVLSVDSCFDDSGNYHHTEVGLV